MSNKSDQLTVRRKMAADVKQYVLDPFALIAGWLSELNEGGQFDPNYKDIARLLTLLIMGAHNELDLYCSGVGHTCPPIADVIESILEKGGVA